MAQILKKMNGTLLKRV